MLDGHDDHSFWARDELMAILGGWRLAYEDDSFLTEVSATEGVANIIVTDCDGDKYRVEVRQIPN